MLLILEGLDGSGKTTLAQSLSAALGCDRVHHGAPSPLGAYVDYVEDLDAYRKGNHKHLVIDRSWPGEEVWGPLFRGESELTRTELMILDTETYLLGGLIVYVDVEPETGDYRLIRRGEERAPYDRYRAKNMYENLLDECITPTIMVDTTNSSVSQVTLEILTEAVHITEPLIRLTHQQERSSK